jgi:hypothetical protein
MDTRHPASVEGRDGQHQYKRQPIKIYLGILDLNGFKSPGILY